MTARAQRQRVWVEGGGSVASADIAPGAATIPVNSGAWYLSTGGFFVSGPQRGAYTGTSILDGSGSAVAGKALSPAAPSAALVAGTPGRLGVGAYQYRTTVVLPAGESEVSGASSAATITAIAAPSAPSAAAVVGTVRTVSSLTRVATVASVTTTTAHGYGTGERVTIANVTQAAYNGTFSIVVTGSTTFTYGVNGNPATPATTTTTIKANASQAGSLSSGAYKYKTTYETQAGETLASAASSVLTFPAVTPPGGVISGGSITATTGGNLTPSKTYGYNLTYLTPDGETDSGGGLAEVALSSAQNAVAITNMVVSADGRVTGRKLYRRNTSDGGSFALVGTFDNVVTNVLDTLADAEAGVGLPTASTATAGGRVTVTIPVSGDGRVTKRRIYRTIADGSVFKLAHIVGNNTETLIADNVADSNLGDTEPVVTVAGTGQITVSAIPLGPAGTTARRLYRTEADGTSFRSLVTLHDNSTTVFVDNRSDDALGEAAPVESHVGVTAGETVLRVKDTTNFAILGAEGWVRVGEQIVKFTGRSVSSGEGTLTGIPATGVGAIRTPIGAGASVVNHPHLYGVSGVLYPIRAGDEVNLLVQCDDLAAQDALVALENSSFMQGDVAQFDLLGTSNSDGIIEHSLQDRRLSEGEARALGNADLALFSRPITSIRYATHDPKTRSGKTVHVDLPALGIVGDFVIQSVTIDQIDISPRLWPRYTVEASSVRFSFEDVLRRVRLST